MTKISGKYGNCPECGSDWLKKNGTRPRATGRVQAYRCKTCGADFVTPRPPRDKVPMRDSLPKVKRYVVTCAQNATPLHEPLWKSLQQCAEYYGAELVVVPGRYRNPTSQWTEGNADHEWWDERVLPYLTRGRINLGDRLTLLGDVKVQWAAMNPLTSLDTLTGERSGIVGHPRRALRSIPTPQHKQPKMMFTTGSCTVPNYTDTKQGKIGHFHHSYGGLVVEIAEDRFHVRQINAMQNGTFIDLDKKFTPEGVEDAPRALGLTMGDTHWVWKNEGVHKATFGDKGIVGTLKPRHLFWHDVLDFYTRNHHHRGRWLTEYRKFQIGLDDIEEEVNGTLRYVLENTPEDTLSVVVSSNHDRALERWLTEMDFRKDPINVKFYLERALDAVREVGESGEWTDPFIRYAEDFYKPLDPVKMLRGDESYVLAGVEHSLHGDMGPNGARGSTKNLSRIGIKVTKGHSHTAEIIDGCYSVGKGTGRLEYEAGPSSHSNTHCVQYGNGKRALITIVDGKWRL